MRSVLMSILGFGLLVAPVAASAQTSPNVGIWAATSALPNACMMSGTSNGFSFVLTASTSSPSSFTVDIKGPFPPGTTPSAILFYGAGMSQTLSGTFVNPADLQITLTNDPQNNFATFLHGLTAGLEMSATIGSTAVDFSLAGTSAVVGELGQCTVAGNFNSLPAPWRPAVDAPATAMAPVAPVVPIAPVTLASAPPAPPPVTYQQPTPPPVQWIAYSYGNQDCEAAVISPKMVYEDQTFKQGNTVTIDRENGPDGTLNHVRLTWPDPDNASMTVTNDFFTNVSACEAFKAQLDAPTADLN